MIAFGNLPCWTNFSAALRTFCLLEAKTKRHKSADSSSGSLPRQNHILLPHESSVQVDHSIGIAPSIRRWSLRDKGVIVRLGTQNRMVTKGYRKGKCTTGLPPVPYVRQSDRQQETVETQLATSQTSDNPTISYQDMASAMS